MMLRTTITHLLLLLLLPLATRAQTTQQTFSLEEAIAYAKINSSQIQTAQITIRDAEAQIAELKSTGLPQLNGSAAYTRYLQVPKQPLPEAFVNFLSMGSTEPVDRETSFVLKNNFTAGLNFSMQLFDGTYLIGLKAAKTARAYAQEQLTAAEYQVEKQVVNAYVPVLLVDENLNLLDSNINNVQRLLFETQQTYNAGFAEQLDVDRLVLSASNLETERNNLRRQRETALRSLKFTLNYPLDEQLIVADDLEGLASEAAEELLTGDIDLTRRPELAVIEQGLLLTELNVRRYKAGYLPTLDANAAYQYQYQGDNFKDGFWAPTGLVGLSLNVPIFDGFRKRSQIEQASLQRETVLLQQRDLLRTIQLEIANARTDYRNAGERLEAQRRNLDLARRIYETTQIKYREGVGSSLEVTQAEQGLYAAQSNYLRALFDRLVAKNQVQQALGL